MSPQMTKQDPTQPRPRRAHHRPSVLGYLIILFLVAFLLLMIAYFQQQRLNDEATSDALKQSASAMQSVQIVMEENQNLKAQLKELEDKVAAAEQKAQDNYQLSLDKERVTSSLNKLNTLRSLYNQGRYREARGFLSELGEAGQAQVLADLQEASSLLSEEDRTIYDPVSAWNQLVSWLR